MVRVISTYTVIWAGLIEAQISSPVVKQILQTERSEALLDADPLTQDAWSLLHKYLYPPKATLDKNLE